MAIHQTHKRIFKRSLDIIVALFALATIFPPVWLVVAVIVKVMRRGPVMQRQSARLACYKLALAPSDAARLAAHDIRRFDLLRFNLPDNAMVRHTHIDRLPRLFNILAGHMSFIEPSHMPGDLHAYSTDWTPLTDILGRFR